MSRYDDIDGIPVPDQWSDIVERAESGDLLDLQPDTPRRRLGRVLPAIAVVATVLGAAVAVGVLLDDGATDVVATPTTANQEAEDPDQVPPAQDPPPDPDETIVGTGGVIASPAEVAAGGSVELTFPGGELRGIPWFLSERIEGGWSEPRYLLVADASGHDCSYCPRWSDESGPWEWDDVGITGAGPDVVVIPPVADPGRYRLCDEREDRCVELTISHG